MTAFSPRLREGDSNPKSRLRNHSAIERLMYRTALLDNGCWEWLGSKNPKGYGNIRRDHNGPIISVHKLAYESFVGPVPEGLEIDHLCRNRACVNPRHLEAIVHRENVLRGLHNQNHGKPNCKSGHPFDHPNTRITAGGKRVCRACMRRFQAEHRARKHTQNRNAA